MAMVVLPSPAGVGVIAVTTTSLPSGPALRARRAGSSTLALSRPYGSHSSAASPSSRAMSAIGRVEVGIRHDLLEPVGQRNHLRGGGIPAGVAREPGGHELLGLVADFVGEGEARPPALADPRAGRRAPKQNKGPFMRPLPLEVLAVTDLLDDLPGAAVAIDLLEEVLRRDEPGIVTLPRRVHLLLERPPDDLGQLRPAHAAHGRQHRAVVDVGEELAPRVRLGALAGLLEDFLLVGAVGQRHLDQAIKTARSDERGVDRVGAARGADDDHAGKVL